MKKQLLVALIAAGLAVPALAQSEGNWMVRARAVNINTANKSDAIPGLAGKDDIHVSDKLIPEVDISYFFTPNIAAELVLTYPQEHNVSLNGTKLGTVEQLPPTLLVQYHFMPEAKFRPYVGIGVNYTLFTNDDLVMGLKTENDSVGLALQVGMDVKLADQWYLNVDVKKIKMGTDVELNGSKLTHLDIDPWLVGVGVGYRF
ncbi:OmpW family protein [Nitrogeniibacter mangrovi]|uniref:OmpW family protein n=1 Tax=Nitrogeniibacter mangrovi TaxID=2016596 RepID=A0A6C1BB26_9RHOO|nr:OmpW family outer membrane protein [Nitrogeniibacter mangrovi]QID19474.1 OmpW family protein [Nitrogeniibacter mangrovi]